MTEIAFPRICIWRSGSHVEYSARTMPCGISVPAFRKTFYVYASVRRMFSCSRQTHSDLRFSNSPRHTLFSLPTSTFPPQCIHFPSHSTFADSFSRLLCIICTQLFNHGPSALILCPPRCRLSVRPVYPTFLSVPMLVSQPLRFTPFCLSSQHHKTKKPHVVSCFV